MFLNDKHHPGLKKKNKSPENLRQIDFNNFFKTKNPILDAYAQNIIFGHKIKYLSNHKNKQSNSQSKYKYSNKYKFSITNSSITKLYKQ